MKDIKKNFGPSNWAIDNKTAIYVFTAMIVIAGLFAYNSTPKENFPEVIIPKIFVQTIYPGTSPENMENLVTKKLEKQIKGTKGLKKIISNSYQDFSIITAEFVTNVDIKDAKQRVKDAVDKAKKDLPNNLPNEPSVMDINLSDLPIMHVNLSGNFDLKKLKDYADELRDQIEALPEISGVDIVGALEPEIQINIDLNKMNAVQISFADIKNAVGYENLIASGGTVKMDGFRRTLNVKKEFKNIEEIANLIIRTQTGDGVYLRDIAEVKNGFKEQRSYSSLFGKNVITLEVKKRAGQNLIEASNKINALIADMHGKSLPKSLDIKITGDQSNKTRITLHDLINTIVIGFILVTIILMFFMGITNALFVALSVPLSMFIAFLSIPILGGVFDFNFTMNMIVLFSFLLGLGIVVDDAIVVIENTHRIFKTEKISIVEAAKTAAGEVFLPVFSGTLTTLAPFFPLLFWPGIIGKFMLFLPITLIVTLSASLLVAYIINPVFAVDFMSHQEYDENKGSRFDKRVKKTMVIFGCLALPGYLINIGIGNFLVFIALFYLLNHFFLKRIIYKFQNKIWPAFQNKYANLLRWCVKHPKKLIWGTLGLFFATLFLFGSLVGSGRQKIIFFPSADPNFIYVYVNLPIGTDQAYTNQVVKNIEQKVTKALSENGKVDPIVTSIISNVTIAVTDPHDEDQGEYPNRGKISVAFVEYGKRNGKKTSLYLDKIRNVVKNTPGAEISVAQEQSGPPTAKPISIEITGNNLDSIVHTSERLKKYLVNKQIAGVEELKSDFQNNKPEVIFSIDRERANREGIYTGQIAEELRTALYGQEISKFKDENQDYEINLRAKDEQKSKLEILRNIKVTFRDIAMGFQIRQVPISSFTKIDYVNTYGGIKRKQQKRIITLSSNVLNNYNPNQVVQNVAKEVKQFQAPQDVNIRMAGDQEEQAETMGFLSKAALSAIGLILIILVTQFNSISKPIIILAEVLFCIIGVLVGCMIFNMSFSIMMSMLGIVALIGIVVRNGILLVEFTDMMVNQGMSVHDAVIEAGRTRMTPVLLTATATILGLIPLAVGLNLDFVTLFTDLNPHIYFGGDNVAFWGPLSWTMIFGLSFATFLTLILVPCMYIVMDKNSKAIKSWFKKK